MAIHEDDEFRSRHGDSGRDQDSWDAEPDESNLAGDERTIVPCPQCRKLIFEGSVKCPYCRQWLRQDDPAAGGSARRKPLWWWLTVIFCILAAGGFTILVGILWLLGLLVGRAP